MLERDVESEIGDYFRANLLAVRQAVKTDDFKKFSALKTDGERVAFILKYPEARLLPLEFPGVGERDRDRALKLKITGNSSFGRGQFLKALEHYSDAAIVAPESELSVILANRSAVLYYLENFELAISDAEEAVRLGYPQELLYKLEERRAKCLLALKRNAAAVDAFRNTLKVLDHAKVTPEKKQKIEYDVRMMLAVMERGNQLNKNVNLENQAPPPPSKVLPDLSGHQNPDYPSFSDVVDFKESEGAIGRYAVSKKKILPGEVLATEKPHAAVLLSEFRLTHCHLCFTRVTAPVPASCNSCTIIIYCSTKCRNRDAKVHVIECPLLLALYVSAASVTCFLALKSVSQRPLNELKKLRDSLKVGTKIKPWKGDDYRSFHNLVTHEDERTPEDIFHRAYMASWLLRLLKRSSYFSNEMNTLDAAESQLSTDEIFVGGLLLHNIQLLQFNAHEISELIRPKDTTTLDKAKSIFVGGGVFPTVALLNHSCNPSVIRYFVGTTMVLRALRIIRPGEEISENYGPIFTTMPLSERKRKLRLQYWFDCACEACTNHWPLLEGIDPRILRFRCDSGEACGNILPVSTESNEFMVACPKCKKSTNILKGLKAIQDTDAIFKTASRHLENGEHENALKELPSQSANVPEIQRRSLDCRTANMFACLPSCWACLRYMYTGYKASDKNCPAPEMYPKGRF